MRSKLKALALNVTLLLVSLLLAAGCAEIAVRVAKPQQLIMLRPDIWQPADSVGWVHRANVRTQVNTGEGEVTLVTDADGFRVARDSRPREGAKVLVLGDSFMEALQVEYEESMSGLLEDQLAAAGIPVVVHNAGIDGWTPSQYLLRASSVLPQQPFDLVVVGLYLGNDVLERKDEYVPPRTPVVRHAFRIPESLAPRDMVDAFLKPVNDRLETRSHLYILLRNHLSILRMRLGLSALYFPDVFQKSEADSPRWSATADICAEIAALAQSHGAETLFVLIPTPYQVNPAEFERYVAGFGIDPATVDLDQPNRRMIAELQSRGLRTVDALDVFREANSSGQRLYGTVDTHLTADGHRLLTELVAPAAVALLGRSDPGT